MQRREFLASGVGATALGTGAITLPVWLAGCGGGMARPELGSAETTELLSRLERGLGRVDEAPAGMLAAERPWQLRPDLTEPMLRLGVQALVVADVARSIPDNTTVPTELRDRLLETLPILDRCTTSYHRLLSTTPPAVRRNVDRAFRTDPDTAMNVASYLDGHALTLGVSPESRVRLRSNASWVGTRIRRQSTNALVDETLHKVERAVARSGGSVEALRARTTSGFVDAIWAAVDGDGTGGSVVVPPPPPGYGATASGVLAPTDPSMTPYEVPPAVEEPPSGSPGDDELVIGGVLIGSGLAAFGIATLIGFALGSVAWGAIIGATPGSALVITGIIVMIVGAVQNANAG